MSKRNTISRSLHDLGGAAWFGGALMGAVALNGATRDVDDPTDRTRVASAGWARLSPVATGAIGAHLVGGLGLVVANRQRIRAQSGVRSNTVAKTVLTAAALATTAYSGILGKALLDAGPVFAEGGTIADEATPEDVAAKQQQLRILQWATPAFVAALIVMGAQQGEQQKASQVAKGVAARTVRMARRA